VTSGSATSLPIAWVNSSPAAARSAHACASGAKSSFSTAGLTRTRPAISGCFVARYRASDPPIDKPLTTTLSVRAARSA
jgi:hypothetical protein